MRKIFALAMVSIMLFSSIFFTGCGKKPTEADGKPVSIDHQADSAVVTSTDLMEGVTTSEGIYYAKADPVSLKKALGFSAKLFEKTYKNGENTLVSPLSVILALAMTANGADHNTLAQFEDVFGLKMEDLNALLGAFITELEKDESCLKTANAIWYKAWDKFALKAGFLQTNADIYKASFYKAPFDETTLKDINGWVENHTDGMIKDILDRIGDDAVMYLVNALVFTAKWADEYNERQITSETFNNASGSTKMVTALSSTEGSYIKTPCATGFSKPYEGNRYSFIALLPNEGKTVEDVIASLSDTLENLSTYMTDEEVYVRFPKFTVDYKTELQDALKSMGIKEAFAPWADFSGMCTIDGMDGGVHISRVIHQTHIEVDEKGTKAAAATVVEMECGGIAVMPEVILDRPFVYMIYDSFTGMPVFIGNVSEL